jgi:hypothetical protein
MTMQQIPAITARGRSTGGNISLFHSASHPAAQHNTAASGRGERLVPADGSVTSATEIAAHACGNTPIRTSAPLAALPNRSWKRHLKVHNRRSSTFDAFCTTLLNEW